MIIDYKYLRPQKAAALKAWHEEKVEIKDTLQVWSGRNATILPIRKKSYDIFVDGTGAVVDSDLNPVMLSETEPTVSVGHSFTHSEFLDKKVVYCGYLIKHWGHFLMEAVARLWYFLENDDSVDNYVFVIDENENREITGNYRSFLELIGIWDRLLIINKPVTFREVIVPELAFRNHQYISPKFKSIYDAVVENLSIDPNWTSYEKIFLSRSKFINSAPMEFGHEVLDSFFANNGYKVLYPERLPLPELIFYIRKAHIVASISGTPPHHMMFAQDGQQLIILDRSAVNNDYQVCVDYLRDLKVTYIDANLPIYTVRMPGPHIIAYTEHLKRFAAEQNSMVPPDPQYCSDTFLKACFVKYIKCYEDNYRANWFTASGIISSMNYMYEGYLESTQYFGDYLNGSKPFLLRHYFQFHYWKQFIKRILKHLRK